MVYQCFGPIHRKEEKRKSFARGSNVPFVWDTFKVQLTAKVMDRLSKVDIELVMVPKNMVHLLQLLDLTTDTPSKKYEKSVILREGNVGSKNDPACNVTLIKVGFRLSTLKHYAPFMTYLYQYLNSDKGKAIT